MTALLTDRAEISPLEHWYQSEIADVTADQSFVVVELQLHDPSVNRLDALSATEQIDSQAAGEYLRFLQSCLRIENDSDGSFARADLVLPIDGEQYIRVEKLLAQPKKTNKAGQPFAFSNSYRFTATSVDQSVPGKPTFTATLRLAENKQRSPRQVRPATSVLGADGKPARTELVSAGSKFLDMIPGTFVQGLLMSYVKLPGMEHVPNKLRAGICQEVAQQLTSYLGQLASSRVRGEVSFPTVETRNTQERLRDYRAALDVLAHDLRPLSRKTENKGREHQRTVITDKRWLAVVKAVDPHPLTLFFVNGASVRIFRGQAIQQTNQPENVRHGAKHRSPAYRPWETRSSASEAGKKTIGLTQYYGAIPLTSDHPQIQEAFEYRNPNGGRKLDMNFQPVPLHGNALKGKQLRVNAEDILVPLSFDRSRLEHILNSNRHEIAWSRLVRKRESWYLQLTLRVRQPKLAATTKILAVSLGLDTLATWSLANQDGECVESGHLGPNSQIQTFMREKKRLEWDQQKDRWIGGRRFYRQLEQIAHRSANELLALAKAKAATLVVEDIGWVQKSGPDSAANMRFTAWNYGQLRRILQYKAGLLGVAVGFVSGFHTRNTSDAGEKTRIITAQFIKDWEEKERRKRTTE